MGNWTVPPPKLDTEQKEFLEKHLFSGNKYWISGFPGSGKSTLLSHAIRLIKADKPNVSILVVVFTRSLIEMFQAAFKEMGLGPIEIKTMFEFMKSSRRYDYILCDEVQDLTPRIIRELSIRSSILIVAGDENQSIFEIDPRYNEPTVNPNQITSLIAGEQYQLTIVHRLSPAIQRAIQKLIPALSNLARLSNMADHTTQIRLCQAISPDQEIEYIWRESMKAPKVGKTSAILFPNHQAVVNFVQDVIRLENKQQWEQSTNEYGIVDFGDMNNHLKNQDIKLQYVGNRYGSFNITNCVYIMTYYSAKGLDFDNVFLPGINNRLYITSSSELSKRIFMVAMTRSRNMLYVCYHGIPHPYTNCFSSDCAKVNIREVLNLQLSSGISFGNGTSNNSNKTSDNIIGF